MKTINELDKWCNADGMGDEEAIPIYVLRKSAIEDVKELFKKHIFKSKELQKLGLLDEKIEVEELQTHTVLKINKNIELEWIKAKIEYIMEKFNLTEEDLL